MLGSSFPCLFQPCPYRQHHRWPWNRDGGKKADEQQGHFFLNSGVTHFGHHFVKEDGDIT